MEETVTVYLLGREYEVPATLTIMDAMEYAGFNLVRGCGCRNGFCGACAVIYRIKGTTEIKVVLSCQTKVEDGMCVGKIDSFPLNRRSFNIDEISADPYLVSHLYPEINDCINCNSCTAGCPQGLKVMGYIAMAKTGRYDLAAKMSFDCVGCNICASRCPASISHSAVGLLCRRITGRYIRPEAEHLTEMVGEVKNGAYDELMKKMKALSEDELKQLYNSREIEK